MPKAILNKEATAFKDEPGLYNKIELPKKNVK
jgi:hypothetical protein